MKKTLLKLLSLSSLLAFTSPAFADQNFYAGIDANYQMLQADAYDLLETDKKVSTSKYYETKSLSPNFFAGFDSGKNFKIELGYKQSSTNQSFTAKNDEYDIVGKHKLENKALSLDFRPYAKINENLLVYGIAGLTRYQFKLTQSGKDLVSGESNSTSGKITKTVPTVGFGAEFKVTKNFFTRAQAKYSHINEAFKYTDGTKLLKIKGATDLALGVGFYF